MNRQFFSKTVSALTIAILLIGLLIPDFRFIGAATLSTAYDRLSRVQANLATGVEHNIVFTTVGAVSGATDSVLVLQFPDADDTKWCRTEGTDLTVAGITEDSATSLPGTLTAKCTQGSGASNYDKIYICATDTNTWAAATKYGVQVKDGSTGKLGTATAAANNIKAVLTTGTAASCTDPTGVDTANIGFSLITSDQVAVTATVDPLITFSLNDVAIGFGTFSTTTKRYATADATGSESAAGNGEPTVATISTNAANGAIVTARSKGNGTGAEGNGSAGLYNSTASELLAAAASSAVVTGTAGYGLYLKNVTNTTGTLSIAAGFDNNASGDLAISTTAQTVASATAVVNATVDVALTAAIAVTTKSGSYTDTITLTGTGKY